MSKREFDVNYTDKVEMEKLRRDPDLNQDGTVESKEIALVERKMKTQRKMAWTAIISMLIVTFVLFTPIISDSRVNALGDLLGLFYIAQAGIAGAYMGFTSWMNRR